MESVQNLWVKATSWIGFTSEDSLDKDLEELNPNSEDSNYKSKIYRTAALMGCFFSFVSNLQDISVHKYFCKMRHCSRKMQ